MNNNKRYISIVLAAALAVLSLPAMVSAHGTYVDFRSKAIKTIPTYIETALTEEEKAATEFKGEIFRLVNIEREKAGVARLKAIEELTKASDFRAQESAKLFSHTRPDGSKWVTVYDTYKLNYKNAGENLSYGIKTPEALMKAWMDSPSHKDNILNPHFECLGVGYYKSLKGKIYVSQLFYTPMPVETVAPAGSETVK